MAQPVSDSDRKKLEAALASALAMIYAGKTREAMAMLGTVEGEIHLSAAAIAKVNAFAAERAKLIQDGINQAIASAVDSLPADASAEDTQAATATEVGKIADYNDATLIPFLTSWAVHQAVVDVYQNTPGAEEGQSAADEVQWIWQQFTDEDDSCRSAMEASPASLEDIFAITDGPPPVHPNCPCQLTPDNGYAPIFGLHPA